MKMETKLEEFGGDWSRPGAETEKTRRMNGGGSGSAEG